MARFIYCRDSKIYCLNTSEFTYYIICQCGPRLLPWRASFKWREILTKIEMNNSSGWGELECGNKEV